MPVGSAYGDLVCGVCLTCEESNHRHQVQYRCQKDKEIVPPRLTHDSQPCMKTEAHGCPTEKLHLSVYILLCTEAEQPTWNVIVIPYMVAG